jgi:hypothetical protein
MLENVPISAYAICYGPLALTIIGFIVFAALTDRNARRTYLRHMNPLTEDEQPESQPIQRDRPIRAETPAGPRVQINPEGQG